VTGRGSLQAGECDAREVKIAPLVFHTPFFTELDNKAGSTGNPGLFGGDLVTILSSNLSWSRPDNDEEVQIEPENTGKYLCMGVLSR